IACWDRIHCIAMSDPVDNKFVLVNTNDGGLIWKSLDTTKMPATKDGEAAFAASGTCLFSNSSIFFWIVSGGKDARVFFRHVSKDQGYVWNVSDTPFGRNTAGSGIFSIAMRYLRNG